ncbi:hypothetical protein BpHYR1_048224, partial [Brachionus plicatilis]
MMSDRLGLLLARLVPFFQLVLNSSEMAKFDADLMLRRNIVLLDQAGEVGLDRFLAL